MSERETQDDYRRRVEANPYRSPITPGVTPSEYQTLAARTLTVERAGTYTPQEVYVAGAILSLCMRMAKIAELTKKQIFRKKGLNVELLRAELLQFCFVAGQMAGYIHRSEEFDEIQPRNEIAKIQHLLGAFGELGEVTDEIIQVEPNGDNIKEELGDLAWKLAALCTLHGLSMEDVMRANIAKLLKRRPPA